MRQGQGGWALPVSDDGCVCVLSSVVAGRPPGWQGPLQICAETQPGPGQRHRGPERGAGRDL